jgi:3-isopropylmalate/(R)-2-methylmalate dehydratase small subunit
MEPIKAFTSTIVALPVQDVDTDQIIPARFLRTTNKVGLGDALFSDWRYNSDGSSKPDFVLNRPDVGGAQVLVAGHNFGCGSSREHAVWALQGYGFKAVVSTYFASIFYNNALKTGLLPIVVDEETYYQLVSLFEEDPETQITVDLASQTMTLPEGQSITFPIDSFAKYCLISGVDQMGFLLEQEDRISAYEATQARTVNTVT